MIHIKINVYKNNQPDNRYSIHLAVVQLLTPWHLLNYIPFLFSKSDQDFRVLLIMRPEISYFGFTDGTILIY